MALALAPHKIRVNAIGPGSIMTEVLTSVVDDKLAMNRCARNNRLYPLRNASHSCIFHVRLATVEQVEAGWICHDQGMFGLFFGFASCQGLLPNQVDG